MTDEVDHGRTHAGLVVPGLLLAPTALGALVGVARDVLPAVDRTPLPVLLTVVAILVALTFTFVTGIHVLVVGTGGGGGRLAPAWRTLRVALVATGTAALLGLLALVLGGRQADPALDAGSVLVATAWAAACFVLARRIRVRPAAEADASWPAMALTIHALPVLLLMAALTIVLAAGH